MDIFCDSKHPFSTPSVTSVVLSLIIYSSNYFLDLTTEDTEIPEIANFVVKRVDRKYFQEILPCMYWLFVQGHSWNLKKNDMAIVVYLSRSHIKIRSKSRIWAISCTNPLSGIETFCRYLFIVSPLQQYRMVPWSHRSCIDPYPAKGHLITMFYQYYPGDTIA